MARRKYNVEIIKQIVGGENPFYQSGYTKAVKPKKTGELVVDNKGVTWKYIDNTSKVRVNKQADLIRGMTKRLCSICKRDMDYSKNRLDKKVFLKTGKCYDCLESEEMIIRLSGNWESYEKKKMLNNKLGVLKDFKEKVI